MQPAVFAVNERRVPIELIVPVGSMNELTEENQARKVSPVLALNLELVSGVSLTDVSRNWPQLGDGDREAI